MSLATRCPACNTVFRVVQDQLKVSEGWVRCGRCQEVFNALESLFDLEPAATAAADAPPPAAEPGAPAPAGPQAPGSPAHLPPPAEAIETPRASAPGDFVDAAPPAIAASATIEAAPGTVGPSSAEPIAPAMSTPALAAPAVAAPAATPETWRPGTADVDADDAADDARAPAVADDTPAARLDARDRHDFADARFNSELLAEEGIVVPDDAASRPAGDTEPPSEATTPEFVRRAERHARWSRPGVVVTMVALCGVLLLGLATQVALHFRDFAAATWPAARPTLEALCEHVGCRIEPVRRIDDIVIESSALTGAPSGDAVRLAVVLRNRGALPLAVPSIELTLTDVGGQMIARRALSPAEFGAQGETLPAASETPLQLVLAVSGRRPSGYTVEPFYP